MIIHPNRIAFLLCKYYSVCVRGGSGIIKKNLCLQIDVFFRCVYRDIVKYPTKHCMTCGSIQSWKTGKLALRNIIIEYLLWFWFVCCFYLFFSLFFIILLQELMNKYRVVAVYYIRQASHFINFIGSKST